MQRFRDRGYGGGERFIALERGKSWQRVEDTVSLRIGSRHLHVFDVTGGRLRRA
jgi:hypothetical protein